MDVKFHYVSKRTLDKSLKKNITLPIDTHFLNDYNLIKKNNNYWGIFLRNKDKIIGNTLLKYEKEDNINYLLLVSVYINEKYRGHKLCNELVKQTIIKNETRNKPNLIKVCIAGGMPILKCLLRVCSELNYIIKKYKTNAENIQMLQSILPETAIKIEKSNYKNDIWQTLFFDKNH